MLRARGTIPRAMRGRLPLHGVSPIAMTWHAGRASEIPLNQSRRLPPGCVSVRPVVSVARERRTCGQRGRESGTVPMEKHIERPGLIVFACAFGAFLATFNETFFNVALVPIMNDLAVSASTAQWLVTANMLVAAVFVPIAGFLYKSISTKPMYLLAVGFLIVGSLIGCFANNFAMVLAARVVQAIGAGMVPVVCMNMTLAVAPKGRLGTYIGIVGAMTTLGPSSSPLVSGIVLNFASWRMLFVVYGILTVICFVYGAITLEPVADLTHPKLDATSTVLITIGLVGLMYGISTAFSGTPLIAAVAAVIGIVALAIFVRRQMRIEVPLIDLRPFKSPAFTVGALCVLLSLMSVFSMNIIMPTFMQESLGFTALAASITLFPAVMCACIFSPIAGRLFDKVGIRPLAPSGMMLILVFEVALLVLVGMCGLESPAIWLAVLYAPVIAGAQFLIGPSQSFALSSLPRELNTHGVVILSTIFQIAGCLGTSLFVGFYALGESSSLAAGTSEALASMAGFTWACALGIGIAVLGVICGFVAGWLDSRGTAVAVTAVEEAGEERAVQPVEQPALEAVLQRDAWTVAENASVFDALRVMSDKHTSGLPVIDGGGHVVGFIDSGDVTRYLTGEAGETASYMAYMLFAGESDSLDSRMAELRTLGVMELATPRVITTDYADGVEAVARVLSRHSIKKVPVTSGGVLVGTVSRSDLVRHWFREASERG